MMMMMIYNPYITILYCIYSRALKLLLSKKLPERTKIFHIDLLAGLSSSSVDKENILFNQNLIISQQLPVLSTSSMSADSGINILQTRLRQSSMGSNHNDDESTNTSSGSSNPSSSISSSITGISSSNSQNKIYENTVDSHTEDNLNKETAYEDIYKSPMYFGTENSTVITTQIGATAHIPCTIHNIGDGVVRYVSVTHFVNLDVSIASFLIFEKVFL